MLKYITLPTVARHTVRVAIEPFLLLMHILRKLMHPMLLLRKLMHPILLIRKLMHPMNLLCMHRMPLLRKWMHPIHLLRKWMHRVALRSSYGSVVDTDPCVWARVASDAQHSTSGAHMEL